MCINMYLLYIKFHKQEKVQEDMSSPATWKMFLINFMCSECQRQKPSWQPEGNFANVRASSQRPHGWTALLRAASYWDKFFLLAVWRGHVESTEKYYQVRKRNIILSTWRKSALMETIHKSEERFRKLRSGGGGTGQSLCDFSITRVEILKDRSGIDRKILKSGEITQETYRF